MIHRAFIIYGLGFGTGVILTIWVAVSVAGGKPTPYPTHVVTVVSVVTATPLPRTPTPIVLVPITPPTPAQNGGSASQVTAITSTLLESTAGVTAGVTAGGSGSAGIFTPTAIRLSPTTTHLPTPDITPRPTPRVGGPTTTELLRGPDDEDPLTPVWTCGSPVPPHFPFTVPPGCDPASRRTP